MRKSESILELLLFLFVCSFLLYIALLSCLSSTGVKLAPPVGAFGNCLFVLQLIFWASFEEILYRVYFPNKLESFFLSSVNGLSYDVGKSVFLRFCTFLFPHLLFAIAHLYLGWLNVIFAFFFISVFAKTICVQQT